MITIKTNVNGREVPVNEFASSIEHAAHMKAAEGVRARLESVRCPVHHKPLTSITLKKAEGGVANFDLAGCCQTLIDACQDELR
jgi:hypothetical protein